MCGLAFADRWWDKEKNALYKRSHSNIIYKKKTKIIIDKNPLTETMELYKTDWLVGSNCIVGHD